MNPHILVCRPGKPGERLVKRLAEHGLDVYHGPTLSIQARPFNPPHDRYDNIIFISPSAVEASVFLEPHIAMYSDSVIAVGSGTQSILEEAGVKGVKIPEVFNSEGLLAMPELDNVSGKRILIVKGKGGRPLLKDTLASRGAEIDSLDVYERQPIVVEKDIWHWFWQSSVNRHLTCASVETLESFDKQRCADNLPLDVTIHVASERIAEAGRRLGYTRINNVGGAANDNFVTALINITDV